MYPFSKNYATMENILQYKGGDFVRFAEVVRSEPAQYVAEVGAVLALDEKVSHFKHPIIVTGEKSFSAFQKHYQKEVVYPVLKYDYSASHEDMDRLAEEAAQYQADVVIAIGGGKLLDTAKGVAERLNVDIVFIPTVIGTCACVTPVSAVYYPNHQFKAIEYYTRSGLATLVDYQLLVESPVEYFVGGICDTLAKWYEAEGISRNYTFEELPVMVQLGVATSKVTQDILLRDTKDAMESHAQKKVTPAFQRVVDTVFAVSGYVGCQGGEYGRSAGAHAIHNALTQYSETDRIQHGVKVAYGILVQLCATGDEEEVRRLLPFYKENGFKYSWDQLGITENKEVAYEAVAQVAAKDSFLMVKPNVTVEEIVQAIKRVEELVAEVLGE